jgi:hypothetical protein
LRYFHEHPAFAGSQRLFWWEVPDADLPEISSRMARAYLSGRDGWEEDCGSLFKGSGPFMLYGD